MKALIALGTLAVAASHAWSQDTRPYELSSAGKQLNVVYQRLLSQMDALAGMVGPE
jgi:hypothetical protein